MWWSIDMSRKKHSPEKVEQFWKMRADGYSYEQIKEKIKVPVNTLQDWQQQRSRAGLHARMRSKYSQERGADGANAG